MVDWSALPTDAICFVSTRLSNDADYVRFRSVCTSWRSATPKRYPHLPWLLVVHPADTAAAAARVDGIRTPRDVFFELCNFPNTTDFFNPPHLPDQGLIRDKFICGSSRGWIAILDDAPGVSLHNPFTGLHVRLPLLTDLPPTKSGGWGFRVTKSDQGFAFVEADGTRMMSEPFTSFGTFLAKKAVLSSDPATSPQDCIVMALCYNGERLIHCRPGDASWTPLSPAFHINFFRFQDIIFYNGRFYAVSKFRLFVCDTTGPDAKAHEILPANPLFSDGQPQGELENPSVQSYLVVSSGDLLLTAIQETFDNGCLVYSCKVFRVDLGGGKLRLVMMENLGGRALFLGDISMSLSTESSSWCKGNCIYYSHMTTKTAPHSPLQLRRGHSTRVVVYNTIRVFSMEDGNSSSITSLSDHFWGLHWFTRSLC